jgi:hypothetical protein
MKRSARVARKACHFDHLNRLRFPSIGVVTLRPKPSSSDKRMGRGALRGSDEFDSPTWGTATVRSLYSVWRRATTQPTSHRKRWPVLLSFCFFAPRDDSSAREQAAKPPRQATKSDGLWYKVWRRSRALPQRGRAGSFQRSSIRDQLKAGSSLPPCSTILRAPQRFSWLARSTGFFRDCAWKKRPLLGGPQTRVYATGTRGIGRLAAQPGTRSSGGTKTRSSCSTRFFRDCARKKRPFGATHRPL